jgi:two-component system CheB/CheR fusion protein
MGRPLDDRRILLVDDQADTLEMLELALSHAGADVEAARDPAAGLSILRRIHIDAAVCDLRMPEIDGYEWVRRVRAMPEPHFRTLPVIALTGDDSWRYRNPLHAASAGFDYHLTKPVDLAILVETLARLLVGHRPPSGTQAPHRK